MVITIKLSVSGQAQPYRYLSLETPSGCDRPDQVRDAEASASIGGLLKVANFDLEAPDAWNDHLALWASCRSTEARTLSQGVMRQLAPELAAGLPTGVPEIAKRQYCGLHPACLHRPRPARRASPQVTMDGHSLWDASGWPPAE